MEINIKNLLGSLKSRGYKIFEQPYELNIVGIRANSVIPNKFDDTINVFWKTNTGKWELMSFPATTDPGTYFLKYPMNNLGAALLKPNQYIDSHRIGSHRGKYEALVQAKPVTVWRDYNRDAILDFMNGRENTDKPGSLFGINIHKAGGVGTTLDVNKWSAGCQVFANTDDFNRFMEVARKHRDLYGNHFTYTLIDERAMARTIKRRGMYGLVAVLVGVAGYSFYKVFYKK